MRKFTWSGLLLLLALISMQLQASNPVISVSTEPTKSQVLRSNQSGMDLEFHFGDINTMNVKTEMGVFTELHMKGAYSTNRVGEPKLPAQRKLIAIPFGAEVSVNVTSFEVSTIDMSKSGLTNPIMPLQYDLPKSMDVSDVPFQYKAEAYAAKSFNESEIASIEVLGVMRGVRIARVTVEPVRYNPSSKQLEVYNNIEVNVSYNNADWALTEQRFKNTYSPYFDMVYSPLMNLDDVYDDHPDLLTFPVHMLIVADPMFEETLQPFIEWKTKSGFHLTVTYTDEIGSSTSEIQTWIADQYNDGLASGHAPDFVVLVGDIQQIPASATGSSSARKTDLYYFSIDGDYFPEMYYGRMSAQNTTQLENILNKVITYEKYEMEDPSYLDDVTLIAGADGTWNPAVGQPTIEYGTQYYYNADHGYNNIWVYLSSYSGCYEDEKFSVSFINYTAHCSTGSWADPNLTTADVNNIYNPGKYPLAIGNCCQSSDFDVSECIGEAFVRAEHGAVGYIGSSPSTYWFEDFYWSVGAFPIEGDNNGYVPTYEETTMGAYDGAWGDSYYCQDAILFVGNLAVTEVDIQGYQQHSSPLYYWQAYNTFGDPSLMPYNTQGSVNTVDHMDIVPIGVTEYEVSAEPGSYVAVSKNGVLHGTGYVGESGTTTVELDPILEGGDVDIVVTRSQYIPYMVTIPAAALEGPFLTISEFEFDNGTEVVNYGTTATMDVNIKNLGTDASSEVSITVSSDDEYCTLTSAATIAVGAINPDEVILIEDAFTFAISDDAPDMHMVTLNIDIEGTSKETWEQNLNFKIYAPVPEFGNYTIDDNAGNNNGRIDPGETVNISVEAMNNGHAASLDGNLFVSSSSSYLTINDATVEVDPIAAEGMADITFSVTADEATPIGTVVSMTVEYIAGNYDATNFIQEAVGLIVEDFESGDFSAEFNWQFDSNPWEIVGAGEAYEGEYAAKSKTITHSESSTMYIDYVVDVAGQLSFWYKVSSESNYDYLTFYINDEMQDEWSGAGAWSEATYDLEPGTYNLKWEYSKDGTVSSNDDCAWVDFIVFPGSAENLLVADFSVDNNNPCDGESVNFTSNSFGDVSEWNWTFEGGTPATSTEENPTVVYETPGEYNVSLEVGDGSNTVSTTKTDYIIVSNCTGVAEVASGLNIYPNPNTGVFFMDLQGMESANIKIYNAVGTMVYEESNFTNDNSMKRIDLSQQAEGVYMIIVENENQKLIEKIVIK